MPDDAMKTRHASAEGLRAPWQVGLRRTAAAVHVSFLQHVWSAVVEARQRTQAMSPHAVVRALRMCKGLSVEEHGPCNRPRRLMAVLAAVGGPRQEHRGVHRSNAVTWLGHPRHVTAALAQRPSPKAAHERPKNVESPAVSAAAAICSHSASAEVQVRQAAISQSADRNPLSSLSGAGSFTADVSHVKDHYKAGAQLNPTSMSAGVLDDGKCVGDGQAEASEGSTPDPAETEAPQSIISGQLAGLRRRAKIRQAEC